MVGVIVKNNITVIAIALRAKLIFETIRQLITKKSEPMEPVGFKIGRTRERDEKRDGCDEKKSAKG